MCIMLCVDLPMSHSQHDVTPLGPNTLNPKVSISQMLKGKCHPYLSYLFVYIRYSLKPRIYALVTETMTLSNVGTVRGDKY